VSCVLINLAATPGLGSVMARRFFAGTGQLLLAVAGFVLIVGWMFKMFSQIIRQELDEPVLSNVPDWMWRWGLVFFLAGWLWSLVTSISLLRQVQADETAGQKPMPPPAALPGEPPKTL
jgi:hypothetical protein